MYELKPCPFCGGRMFLIGCGDDIHANGMTDYYHVQCDPQYGGCGASCGAEESEELAALAWNRRGDSQ